MPTNKPRYNLTVDKNLLDRITRYQCDNAIGSMNGAIIELITIGLSAARKETIPQVFNKEELYLINAFREAPDSLQQQFLSLVNASLLLSRERRRHDPMHKPEYDLLSVMAGYELSDADTRAKIDALIADALKQSLSSMGSNSGYGDLSDVIDASDQESAARRMATGVDPAAG